MFQTLHEKGFIMPDISNRSSSEPPLERRRIEGQEALRPRSLSSLRRDHGVLASADQELSKKLDKLSEDLKGFDKLLEDFDERSKKSLKTIKEITNVIDNAISNSPKHKEYWDDFKKYMDKILSEAVEEVSQEIEHRNKIAQGYLEKTLQDSRLTDSEKARSLMIIIAQQKDSMRRAYSQLDEIILPYQDRLQSLVRQTRLQSYALQSFLDEGYVGVPVRDRQYPLIYG